MSSVNLSPLERLLRLNSSSANFNDQVCNILDGVEYSIWARHVNGDDITRLIDFLDRALDTLDPASYSFLRCLRELRGTCNAKIALPTSYTISSPVLTIGRRSVASGSSGEVYEGMLSGSKVCIKRVRVYPKDGPERATKMLYQEAIIWKHLEHNNIVPLLGVTTTPLQLISEWMPGGNLTDYIGKRTGVHRLGLVCDIAGGLHYLHSRDMFHGDLKGSNILVDGSGHARIADFYLATVTYDLDWIQTASEGRYRIAAWTAPEILNFEGSYSKEADIFSFAMVMVGVFTGAVPFNYSSSPAVRNAIMTGACPRRPTHPEFTIGLWRLMQCCWDQDPYSRPKVSWILEVLRGMNPPRMNPLESPSRDRLVQNGQSKANLDNTSDSSYPLNLVEVTDETISERTLKRYPPGVNRHQTRNPSQHELRPGAMGGLEDLSDPDLPPPKSSIYNMDSGSSLSVWGLRHSIEIPTMQTSTDPMVPGGIVPSSNPQSLQFAEINAESQGHLAQEFIDRVDMTLDRATCDQERHELLNVLCKICSRQQMLPQSMHVEGGLTGELIEAECGGNATIFRAQHNNCLVAVKTIRVTMNSDFDKCHSEFCREAVAWRHLRHPNILPLLGVDLKEHQLSMISEWMDEGNINEYVEQHGGVNRLQLLAEAATGLEYMHSLNMVHGDLKGANILINQSRRACLADFGLSTIASVEHNTRANASLISVVSKASLMSFTAGGTPRWMSPELLDPERFGASDDRPTKKSDCYALGMVVYEVLSGNPPFWGITNEGTLIYAIMEGYRPKKPDAAEGLWFTDELWETVQRCWLTDADTRPDVRIILSHLSHATWSWERRRVGI